MTDIEVFNANKKYFQNVYLEWSSNFDSRVLHKTWNEHNAVLEREMLPAPPINFLSSPTLAYTMVVDRRGELLKQEVELLEERFSPLQLSELLRETSVGSPSIISERYQTSHNSIHHLYHLARYEAATKNKISDLSSVLEWGAGYANMAKIVRRINKDCTYILVDFPLMSTLQWLYLVSVFGPESVNKVTRDHLKIKQGVFNILPLNLISQVELKVEMFLSTWAISESGKYWQDVVFEKNWFDANKLLLAFQQEDTVFSNSERVGRQAQKDGAIVESLKVIQKNSYAFK